MQPCLPLCATLIACLACCPPNAWLSLLCTFHDAIATPTPIPSRTPPTHFQVEEFLSRLHNLLPACRVLGGVVQPGHDSRASGMASAVPGHGSVFLGPESYHEGAVGCLMQVSLARQYHSDHCA